MDHEVDEQALALASHPSGDDCGAETKELSVISRQETDANLDVLIAELEEEDGRDPEPKTLTVGSNADKDASSEDQDTDPSTGLDDARVEALRRTHGWNTLKEEHQNNFVKFLLLFVGPVQGVMQVAAIVAIILQDWIDLGIIFGLLLLNAVVGFAQEYTAGNIVESLKKGLALEARVIRNSKADNKPVKELVPGDIVLLEDGSVVPADGILVSQSAHLQVDQSCITGESLAVDKYTRDKCFSSSIVKRGAASMVVTHIGDNTSVGKAAAIVREAAHIKGHFTTVLDEISHKILALVILSLLLVWIASFYRSNAIRQILEFTLAISVVGIPVGLPAVVTTTMAVGAGELAKKSCIVRKLSAIESLAGAEMLCSDKTGTLTRNKLALGEPFTLPGVHRDEIILTACLAANRKKKGIDAIDRVFVKALKYYPGPKALISQYVTINFFPFDPVSKKVTAIVKGPTGEEMTCVKGAPLSVLRTVQEANPVPADIENAYKEKLTEFSNRGFRALGVARKIGCGPWQILGIVPCLDPPREDTKQTIVEARQLGLCIKMLTGDAVGIARETARQLGLGTNIYNAERLGVTGAGDMPGSEINDFVEAADGFAEVYPEHKYKVVEILQQRGYLVAMTGDGVNDAPSLKKADTGIAVEGASDAARTAADIVFVQPGLSNIIHAIKCSRQIFHRMYAYLIYRIALTLQMAAFLGLWIIIFNNTLDLRLVFLIAMFADIATLTVAYDRAPYSESPVKWNIPKIWGISVILGAVLATASWIALGTMLLRGENGGIVEGYGAQDPVLFLEITLTQSWLILITRLGSHHQHPMPWKSVPSPQLILAILFVDITATLMCIYGVFVHQETSLLTIARVWVFSIGVELVCGFLYVVLHRSQKFDDLMHGRSLRRKIGQRAVEDFGESDMDSLWELSQVDLEELEAVADCFDIVLSLHRTSTAHEHSN
ncbi:ATPase P-type K/Mg/Cd/Cu/Zn/Na/Ca/Na/H-transporter [Penicillium malachiteum]|uniref:ATPase P-type K/Mg/Cd/Cu/Zn/Na/Ca/Na/H-transporter n=1 Tax=Penicillium malachiteum TaxID=1324776 RepID=UPI002546899C|nr:ATPase P-type K/Mg/Cd/Cu/Zn/Na/Ca/Na/H-transporter [Penicillium malachiteum]KAJ5721857.1 ATPase P-type K/Mg/Cd/Cu/Zn/Na/Ca/Na/H-transporter [Penicillium malachiteum]